MRPPALASQIADSSGETQFLGYETLSSSSRLVALLSGGQPASALALEQEVQVVLDRTPFYAESGGQVGDHGVLRLAAEGGGEVEIRVRDVQKAGGGRIFLHTGTVATASRVAADSTVQATVDPAMRRQARPARCRHFPTM